MKYVLALITSLVILSTLFIGMFYLQFQADIASKEYPQEFEALEKEIVTLAKEASRSLSLEYFISVTRILQQTTPLKDVRVDIKRRTFDDQFLIEKVIAYNPLLKDGIIVDVAIDDAFGEIENKAPSQYELKLSKQVKPFDVIEIKFQVMKEDLIQDVLLPLSFGASLHTTEALDQNISIIKSIETNDFSLTITMMPSLESKSLMDHIIERMAVLISFGTLLLCINYLIYLKLIRLNVKNSIHKLIGYISQILDGKMIKDSTFSSIVTYKELTDLYVTMLELTKRYVNISNELAISKDIIVQKERTDELTGLPNKRSFENDLKYMFIANKQGYIFYLKVDKIGLFTKNHGPEIVDALIEDFAKIIQEYFSTCKDVSGSLYRFFGGEFAMVVYTIDEKMIEETLNSIITLTNSLSDKYYFFDRAIYYGATPFDHYGTVESILQSAQDAYENALKEKVPYCIINGQQQLLLNSKLEETVRDIIKRNDFVLQYLYDTYCFVAAKEIFYQEVSPLLIDSFTYETIPSGKFISIAEKVGLVIDFDKALIEKVLEQIEFGELTHKIGVTLSLTSISNYAFLSWLELLCQKREHIKQVVFSFPGYMIASNMEVFVALNALLKQYAIEMIIKRYDPAELSLENLTKIMPSYIRIERSICQDFKKDSTKQHLVKQILLFAENHEIKVLGDSVKNEQDYIALEMLGLFGTSQ